MLDFAKAFLAMGTMVFLGAMLISPSTFEGAFIHPIPSDLSAALTSTLIMSLPVLAMIALFATADDF